MAEREAEQKVTVFTFRKLSEIKQDFKSVQDLFLHLFRNVNILANGVL